MRKSTLDPYARVLQSFHRSGVRYLVVGMSGINFYSKSPRDAFSTMDYDLFLEPTLQNVEKGARALQRLGFSLGTQEGSATLSNLKPIVRQQKTLVATTPEGLMVELLLKVSGYPFLEMHRDAATFSVHGVPVKVGRLSKLLRSKRLAGRPKDRLFLKRYESILKGEE